MSTIGPTPGAQVRVVVDLGEAPTEIMVLRDELATEGPAREALLQGYEALLGGITPGGTVIVSVAEGASSGVGRYWQDLVYSLSVSAARLGIRLGNPARPGLRAIPKGSAEYERIRLRPTVPLPLHSPSNQSTNQPDSEDASESKPPPPIALPSSDPTLGKV